MTSLPTDEHLKRIRARCVELLALAEKRSHGKWVASGAWVDQAVGECITVVDLTDSDALFIASCAGAAEAGWKATIAAIDALLELGTWFKSPTLDELQSKIIAAWPEELL
jgi:hypothetical protein